ncbi:MAG: hypothetical protein AAB692_00485, partial [Patescibacteria group bacterium]
MKERTLLSRLGNILAAYASLVIWSVFWSGALGMAPRLREVGLVLPDISLSLGFMRHLPMALGFYRHNEIVQVLLMLGLSPMIDELLLLVLP